MDGEFDQAKTEADALFAKGDSHNALSKFSGLAKLGTFDSLDTEAFRVFETEFYDRWRAFVRKHLHLIRSPR